MKLLPSQKSSQRFYWSKKEGGRTVHFDDIPFTVGEDRLLHCQFGEHYFKKKESQGKRLYLQGTRKIGCHAHIKCKTYTLYPAYAVSKQEKEGLSQWALTTLKIDRLAKLREDLQKGEVKQEQRHFVSLPTKEAHKGHATGSGGGFAQKVNPAIIAKITELVGSGITECSEVRRILRHHVNKCLSKELGVTPHINDRAFFPSPTDIRNHIHNAKKALELSKENLRLKLEEWKLSNANMKSYFRPYTKAATTSGCSTEAGHITTHPSKPCSFVGNTGGDDDWHLLAGTKEDCSQTLLFVHQEEWQRDLMVKYGNTISLMDATYKTTQYDLPLYILCLCQD